MSSYSHKTKKSSIDAIHREFCSPYSICLCIFTRTIQKGFFLISFFCSFSLRHKLIFCRKNPQISDNNKTMTRVKLDFKETNGFFFFIYFSLSLFGPEFYYTIFYYSFVVWKNTCTVQHSSVGLLCKF